MAVDYGDNWSQVSSLVKQRDNYTCQICGKKYPPFSPLLHVHHKLELSKGGSSTADNLITVCRSCHCDFHKHMQKRIKRKKCKPLD